MLFLQSILEVRNFIFLLFCCTSFVSYSQSEVLGKHIQDKLLQIERQIQNGEHKQAFSKIQQLEAYKDFIVIDSNRLRVEFLKAQCFYGTKEEQEKAINLLLIGLDELELRPELFKQKIEYTSFLGKIFKSAKNYAKARDYYKMSLNESKFRKDTIAILKSFLSIGTTFYNEGVNDSAIYYYKNVMDYSITIETSETISKIYNNLSVIAVRENNLEQAEEYGNMSLKIKEEEEQKDTIDIALSLLNLSNILYKKKEYNKGEENYLKAYNTVKFLKTKRAFQIKEGALYNLAYVNEQLKDFESAYYYLEDATDLTDSLAQASVAQNISEIEAKYNVSEAERKEEVEKRKRQTTQLYFYGSAASFLIIIVLGYIFYRNYRLKQRTKLDQLENEVHTKIINATIDAKENERKAIAETLHDSVSALLSSANLHLQASKAQLRKDAPKEITKAQTIVNEASVKIRDLSHELISSVLLKFGLAFAVHDMCQKYSNSEISLLSDDNGVKRYEQDFEIKIHNIIEELINNILKHSKAKNATIMLAHRADNKLAIRINDDGVGFDIKKAKYKDGLGLSHINARIKIMRGVFTIDSSSEDGTSIFILVPIQAKKAVA